jgi:alkylation response protein AidB-like acyl-CoA dehydrogenase
MSDEEVLELDLVQYGALGIPEAAGGAEGRPDYIATLIRERFAFVGPGDTLVIRVHRPVPPGHPLEGVELPSVEPPSEALEPRLRRSRMRPPEAPDEG